MQLKRYQTATIKILNNYLQALIRAQSTTDTLATLGLKSSIEWDRDAWGQVRPGAYYGARRNSLGQPTPAVCFKVPTGGGKTLLAVKAVDAIGALYRRQPSGLVLWVVPTTQIYNQTLQSLRDRTHPYRQLLDMASGGRTLVIEKDTTFSPEDIHTNLVILMLMLPSANRQNKETLKLFQDQGGFAAFFPPEDNLEEHAKLIESIPNLDFYTYDSVMGRVAKTSLGNTLRSLNPVIILDEGHKAYSPTAQSTLLNFNPSFILELSATPTPKSNVLVSIAGQDLLREGMIKLDLHVHTKASTDWRDTVIATFQHRNEIHRIADEYESETGVYIRPIALIQVERTGAKQRKAGFIHAEDVRQFLITKLNVLPEQIAVKSSELDEIENINLLSRDCPIRYIITKQALQEGWDCPFAYIVTMLTNPESTTAVTQLVGRVLRQPYARKTGRPELDESHVYCFRAKTSKLLDAIRAGLMREGLGDLTGRVLADSDSAATQIEIPIRSAFTEFAGKVFLPCFVVPDPKQQWRSVGYETDILSRLDWGKIDLKPIKNWVLNPTQTQDSHVRMTLSGYAPSIERFVTTNTSDMPLDRVLITRQLLDVIPNPWVAYEYTNEAIGLLSNRYSHDEIRRDLGFVIQELKKLVDDERKSLAQAVFLDMINKGNLFLYLISGSASQAIPERIRARSGRKLTTRGGDPMQRSLFDVFEDDFNETEKAVALYLDQQATILDWWYRNTPVQGWRLKGWDDDVIPDFIAMRQDPPIVYVLETKGVHLKNENTDYKKALFSLCNGLCRPTPATAVGGLEAGHQVRFEVVFEDEWEQVLNEMLTQ